MDKRAQDPDLTILDEMERRLVLLTTIQAVVALRLALASGRKILGIEVIGSPREGVWSYSFEGSYPGDPYNVLQAIHALNDALPGPWICDPNVRVEIVI